MLKSIVYLNADLAASIALRYACQLATLTGMEINLLHVEPPDTEDHPPGSGWVRRTWEKGLISQATERIGQVIAMEKDRCPTLAPPKILLGQPESGILRTLRESDYDLFITGLLHSFSAQHFYKELHSKFYQQVPCPILMVKNPVEIKRAVILMEPDRTGVAQARTFARIFKGTSVAVDLMTCEFGKAGAAGPEHVDETTLSLAKIAPEDPVAEACAVLKEGGCAPEAILHLAGLPKAVGERLAGYQLVLVSLPHHIGSSSPLVDCLSCIPSALLFCRRS
jgi:hypothetical protein